MQTMLDTGIYAVPEAARLTHVTTGRIRRWLRGYEFAGRRGRRSSPPVWEGQLEPIEHAVALGFLDLIEVQCVDALLQAGVTWPTLRKAHAHAKDMVGHTHPFCTNRFATDGQTVFLRLRMEEGEHDETVWDMKDIQRVFEEIIGPFLRNVEFSDCDLAARWWPMGPDRQVLLDPRRSFGHPIVSEHGVPTASLAAAFRTENDTAVVARWFAVSPVEVRDAVVFETRLAA
jgi:uncharacterized protein (DUF433 family)